MESQSPRGFQFSVKSVVCDGLGAMTSVDSAGPPCFIECVSTAIYQKILEHFMLSPEDKSDGDDESISQQDRPFPQSLNYH